MHCRISTFLGDLLAPPNFSPVQGCLLKGALFPPCLAGAGPLNLAEPRSCSPKAAMFDEWVHLLPSFLAGESLSCSIFSCS